MRSPARISPARLAGIAALLALPACASDRGAGAAAAAQAGGTAGPAAPAPSYMGVETRLLDGDLVNFRVALRPARGQGAEAARAATESYARCAAAQYTLIRGYGFARHLRTIIAEEAGLWRADAVYTISPAMPAGSSKLDAEVVAADCAENGIPMV